MRFNETEYVSPGQMDFVPREQRRQIRKLVIAFCLAIALIFALSFAPNAIGGRSLSAMVSIAVVGALCFYVVYRNQQNLDLVMAAEYQNMLFAQAAAMGSNFCLFVRRDGTIVYADQGLRKVFPHFAYAEAMALEGIFEQGGVPKTDRDRVMSALYSTTTDRLVFPIKSGQETKEYVLTVEPLYRPGGFSIIRGREYRGQRAGMQMMPDVLRTTSADKLDQMLIHSPVGLYVTDQFGRLEYVNPMMEQMLGYAGGELLDSRVAINYLFYQLNSQQVPDDYKLADFSGEALLRKKSGQLVKTKLHQTLLREDDKLIGSVGTIIPLPSSPIHG